MLQHCQPGQHVGPGPWCTRCGVNIYSGRTSPSIKPLASKLLAKLPKYLGMIAITLAIGWFLYIGIEVYRDPEGAAQEIMCSSDTAQNYFLHNRDSWSDAGGHFGRLDTLFFQHDNNPSLRLNSSWQRNVELEVNGLRLVAANYHDVRVPRFLGDIHEDLASLMDDVLLFTEQVGPSIETGDLSAARVTTSRITDEALALAGRVGEFC